MKLIRLSMMAALAVAFALAAIVPAVAADNMVVQNETRNMVRVAIYAAKPTTDIRYDGVIEPNHSLSGYMPTGAIRILATVLVTQVPNGPVRASICTIQYDVHLGSMEQLRYAVRVDGKTCSIKAI
jgi:hypothetical protein